MIKQVTTLTDTSAATILTPAAICKFYAIQNNGSNPVRLSFDGGANWPNQVNGGTGTNPTTSTGYKLAAGSYVAMTLLADKVTPPVIGIMETGTTTLDIVTDDTLST